MPARMAMYRLPIGEGSVVLSTIVDDLLATGTTEDLEYVLESVQGIAREGEEADAPVGS